MAVTTMASANTEKQWESGFLMEWNRDHKFARYTGKSVDKIIQVSEKLGSMPGNQVVQSLVTRLTGNGVTGDSTLEGNEESIGNYGYTHTVDQFRHAVRIGSHEQSKSHIDMLKAAGPLLKDWRMNKHRDDIIAAMLVPNVDGTTAYASCNETQKDAFAAANTDRILYGEAVAGYQASDHSASLLTIDSTNATLDSGILALANRRAKQADPHIRPVMVKGFGEYYVWFVDSLAFRDLLSDSVIINAQQYAMARGKGNPLFMDDDVLWRGNIVHEVPEIDVISGVGTSSIDVSPAFCCGAQAVGYAVGKRAHQISDEWDYANEKGVGIAETSVINKLMFNSVQNGLHTVYVSGVADS